ncbi:TPA: hypothetical protein NGS33_003393 [Vibrio parahaemolyticus]|uniref:hypothetical protein n=1 Tax=Vibrio parahaemolyticus TaxID=670 RepID=UPI00111D6D5F|nr:hypothetical protein [Vibrio parahaemolyticus]TPA81863.1 hypothetical protein DXJ87_21845 [Vibrio parahaemolyticus]HCE1745692.1 hypothetical protein [Vibrio parahaemolyticus]
MEKYPHVGDKIITTFGEFEFNSIEAVDAFVAAHIDEITEVVSELPQEVLNVSVGDLIATKDGQYKFTNQERLDEFVSKNGRDIISVTKAAIKGKRGRKEWIPPDLEEVERLAAEEGLSQRQIANRLGISYETLRKKKRENKEFEEAIEKGRSRANASVVNAMYKQAVSGNVKAGTYFLSCREPKHWNPKVIEAELARIALNEQLAKVSENTGVLQVPLSFNNPAELYAQFAAQQAASQAFVKQKVSEIEDDN